MAATFPPGLLCRRKPATPIPTATPTAIPSQILVSLLGPVPVLVFLPFSEGAMCCCPLRVARAVNQPMCHRAQSPHSSRTHSADIPHSSGARFHLLLFCWSPPLTLWVAHVQSQVGTHICPKRKWRKMLKSRKTRPVASPEAQGYNSSDVARICGVSLRQLQWWDDRNVVSPRQDGHKRIYMPEEVVEISVIAELPRKGFSLQKIRRVLRALPKA